jgi:hypothetical protein
VYIEFGPKEFWQIYTIFSQVSHSKSALCEDSGLMLNASTKFWVYLAAKGVASPKMPEI